MHYIRQYIRQQIVIVIKNRSLCTRKKHISSHSLLTYVKGLDSDCSRCTLIGQTLGPSPSAFPATRAMLNPLLLLPQLGEFLKPEIWDEQCEFG